MFHASLAALPRRRHASCSGIYTNFVSFYKSLSWGAGRGERRTYLENQAITIDKKWNLKMWEMSHTK